MPATAATFQTYMYFDCVLRMSLSNAERLLKDIPADRFAFMPHPNMNHPAFCIGHLSLYPNRVFNLVGRKDLVVEKPGYAELFQAGVPCVNEQKKYPARDELVKHYFDRHRAVGELLPNIPEETWLTENPFEGRFRDLFPTVGLAVNFLMGSHQMVHLGQISAWRRAIGLGPA